MTHDQNTSDADTDDLIRRLGEQDDECDGYSLYHEAAAAIGALRTRDVWATRALRAEAERDALREVVKAADAMRLGLDCPMCDSGKLRNPAKEHWDTCAFANYDAARAKVKP